jgi:prefoldin alpha subunit
MDQEILQRAMILRQQSEEAERQLEFVEQQIKELGEFGESLKELDKKKEQEMLAPLGKGVYTKAKRKDEKLFVEVGAGIVVRKSPNEARKVIEGQLKKFVEAKVQLSSKLEAFALEFHHMLHEIERVKSEKKQ